MSDEQRRENQAEHLGRDPNRPPGVILVVVAFALLTGFAYVMWPDRSPQTSPAVSGGGPSAMTNPAASPTGK